MKIFKAYKVTSGLNEHIQILGAPVNVAAKSKTEAKKLLKAKEPQATFHIELTK